jgi:N-acetylmuramoyl-L-alanine amidase
VEQVRGSELEQEHARGRGFGRVFALVLFGLFFPRFVFAQTIVLDPGHGGTKPGTRATSGVAEKLVVLAIAQAAQASLQSKGLRVLMTRSADEDVSLDARIELANREGAAVFVSFHANHAPVPERRGVETYILAAQASDDATLQLSHAEDEEGGAIPEGFGGDNGEGDLGAILDDLSRTAAHQDAALLAKKIQDRAGAVGGLKPSRGLRQGPFKVLRGAKMPAVLVELGYLSNPAQAAFLASSKGQKAIGDAVAKGVLEYLRAVGPRAR